MYPIRHKQYLSDTVVRMDIESPRVTAKCLPGQFIILRVDQFGERIPLTIAAADPQTGLVTIIFQTVGATTKLLAELPEGDSVMDFVGPLGTPSHLDGMKRVAVVGGGLGCAIAYPQAKALHDRGAKVDVIAGFRGKELIILEREMRSVSDSYYLMTDDGSAGEKGLVTAKLEERILAGEAYDTVIAIGPLVMMKFVCQVTKVHQVPTIVSMNPIMIDGTGMCGGCRLTVGGQTKFACVDGPDFDGHQVDFDEAIRRSRVYAEIEREAAGNHRCRLEGMGNGK